MDYDISGYTLYERQSKFYNAHHCPYCLGYTDLVDSIEVYQESHGLIYICRKCSAWVGVHSGSDQSLGTLAKKPLRDLRFEAHKWFDPLCIAKQQKEGVTKRKARAAGYAWLAKLLDIDPVSCHIGYMNQAQCNTVIAACKKLYLTPEQIEQRRSQAQSNVDTWMQYSKGFLLSIQEFKIMNDHYLEIKQGDKSLKYYPKTNSVTWESRKRNKTEPVGVIEDYINSNFAVK